MKGITCCADCAYYNMKKHRCTRSVDEGKPTDHFYADCPLPTVTLEPQWISVKDRLPDEQEEYLVVEKMPQVKVTIAWYSGNENGWLALDGCFYADGCIIYWMPLPEQPKEEEE